MMFLHEGTLIRETYVVDKPLGSGAFADVYRVRHRYLGRRLAMKVLRQEHIPESQFEALFHEAKLLFELEHPHIVRVFDAGLLEPAYGCRGYFIMEYVPGGALRDYLQGKACLPLTEAVMLARQICDGMAFAHHQQPPIIHRDLKPENILLSYRELGLCAKISDFGLAKYIDEMTRLTSAAGTPVYKPPEAFYNVDTPAGDVFAIGMMLYEMLTGRLPFPAPITSAAQDAQENMRNLLVTARRELPKAPSTLNLAADKDLDEIVLKTLAFTPADRFPSAVELLEALSNYECQLKEMTPATPGSTQAAEYAPLPTAQQYLSQALEYARQATTLPQAIEYLKKAMTLDASLRPKYVRLLGQWEKGIVM